tara:strand:- start:152 stop:553 length:402 start_codon:yes stop_codon:yes gene_type:complete
VEKKEFKAKSSKMVITDGDKVMLVKIANKNLYDLPGGHRERGETAAEAGIRETKEEVGLDISDVEELGSTERKDFFTTQKFSGEIKLQEEEVSDYLWVAVEEINRYNITDEVKKGVELYREKILSDLSKYVVK